MCFELVQWSLALVYILSAWLERGREGGREGGRKGGRGGEGGREREEGRGGKEGREGGYFSHSWNLPEKSGSTHT